MAVPSGIIIAWPSTAASIPTGWTRVTALDGVFLKGSSTAAGATGGASTHTHSVASHNHTATHTHVVAFGTGSGTQVVAFPGTSSAVDQVGAPSHAHDNAVTSSNGGSTASNSATSNTGNNDPAHFVVIWIQSAGTHDLPVGGIVWTPETSAPTNWVYANGGSGSPDLRNRYLKGAAAAGNGGSTGGSSASHSHTASHTHSGSSHTHTRPSSTGTDDSSTLNNADVVGTNATVPHAGHTHPITGSASSSSGTGNSADSDGSSFSSSTNQPLTRLLNPIYKTGSDSNIPTGIVCVWVGSLGSVPATWEVYTDANTRFIGGTASLTSPSNVGSSTHNHSYSHTHTLADHDHTESWGVGTPTPTSAIDSSGTNNTDRNNSTHTNHSVNIVSSGATSSGSASPSIDSPSNDPPFYTVIFIQKADAAPTLTAGPIVSYGALTRTGPNNTPWNIQFTYTDPVQTGANALNWQIRTGTSRSGTLVASGTCTSGVNDSNDIAYNASGLSAGSNTLYLSCDDGTLVSTDQSFTLLRDDAAPNSAGTITQDPTVVDAGSSDYELDFTPDDALSTETDELVWELYTETGGGGTLLDSGTATADSPATAVVTGDTLDADGLTTRYLVIIDGAGNSAEFTYDVNSQVVASANPTLQWRQGGFVRQSRELQWAQGGLARAEKEALWRVFPSNPRLLLTLSGSLGAVVYTYLFQRQTISGILLDDISNAVIGRSSSIELNNDRAVLRTASFRVNPTARDANGSLIVIDPLTDIVRVTMRLLVDGNFELLLPLGVFSLHQPQRHKEPSGQEWSITASDLSIRLIDSTTTTPYTVAASENYLSGTGAVQDILDSFGLLSSLPTTSSVLAVDWTWPPGTPWLTVINDLLHGCGMYSLWFTSNGVAVTREWNSLDGTTPSVAYTDQNMLLSPIDDSDDTTRFANQVIVVIEDPNRPPLSSVATNSDPLNPISTVSLGRTITKKYVADTAADQGTLDLLAERYLEESASLYQRSRIVTMPDPRRQAHEVYTVEIEGDDLYNGSAWWARNWKLKLEVGAPMTHEIARVERIVQ